MKKLLSVLSSTLQGGLRGGLLILALLATTSLWAYDYDFEHNEIRYKIISDEVANHTVEVVGSYTNYATHFTIPQTVIHGAAAYEVIRIGDEAFDNHKTIAVIELPNSITSIGYKAFYNSTLKEIVIPESVTDIEEYAFGSCSKLTSVTISDGVTSIGNNAFSYCSSLTSITIPNSVTSIGSYAFRNCSITSITIPESVTYIGSYAFLSSTLTSIIWNAKNCNDFRDDPNHICDPNHTIFGKNDYVHTIIFGENVEYIPEHLCYDMNSLKSITIPESVTSIGYAAFKGCTSLTSVTLGNSVTSIDAYAFFGCSSLTEITIPENVTYVAHFAFANCPSLTSVTWNAKKCRDFYRNTVGNSTGGTPNSYPFYNEYITSLTFGDSVEYIPAFLCYKMDSITTINIPNSVDSIGENAFMRCEKLESVTIGNNVKGIGSGAFRGCSSLISINIPNSITSIEGWTFMGCSSLTSITIPDSITSIGEDAFYGCSSLTSITIPNSVTSIGERAFAYCSSLTSVTIPNSVTSIGDHAFYDCTSLASVVWNATNYTSDAYYVFDGDTPYQITSFVFGDSVKYIPSFLCGGMSSLTSITIPNSVTSIGDKAFSGCSSLSSITIPNSVTSIGEYAFRGCESLSSVVIGNRVTKIRTETFKDCSSLTSVTIGKKVKEIGTDAFYGCSALAQTNYTGDIAGWCQIALGSFSSNPTYYSKNLFINGEEVKDVVIPNTVTSISSCAFYNCVGISSLTIPESVKSIGYNAFGGCKKLFDIYCYPTTPPEAQENSFANYNVNLYVPCESLKDYQMDMVFGSFKYIQCLKDTPPSEPQDTTIYSPTEGIGVFSVGEGKTVTFSPGNLQYHPANDEWRFAENQADYVGSANSNISATYNGWIDLFGWGTGDAPTKSDTYPDEYKTFVDWGTNKIGDDASNTWRTLSSDEWMYILYNRPNAQSLFALGSVNGVNGIIVLPDNWITPAGVSFVASTANGLSWVGEYYYNYDNNFSHNTYTSEQWVKMEQAGAVFLPASGYRWGEEMIDIGNTSKYWSSTEDDELYAYNVNFYTYYLEPKRSDLRCYGHSVRLVKDLNNTTPEPPVEPEIEEIFIYQPVDSVTICASELPYIWRGMRYTEAGTYTYAEIVEDENYIYHNIYTLDLTVIPSERVVLVEEAYDSYEWHGVVYTESGVYFYEEYCYQEILELTIIPSEDKEYVYEHHNYLVCDADIFVDPITGSTHVISSLIPFSLTWSDTIIGTNIDTIHTFNITPIVSPEPLTEEMLYPIGAVPKLVAGEKVDLMGTTELIMAYYQMVDQHDIADVIGVEWVLGHDVVLDAEQTTHTMVLEVWTQCDYIIPMEFTFPVSKKDSEPQDTTIYISYEDVTICEGITFVWMGMEFTEEGIYTYEEIVVEDDYIYHYIYTLHLMVLPPTLDMYEVTAYDSYEWHGVVYTESGVYTYEEWCYQEILELTIIPSTETAVDNMQTDSDHSAQKILRDQQILILRDDKTYTILGAEVK